MTKIMIMHESQITILTLIMNSVDQSEIKIARSQGFYRSSWGCGWVGVLVGKGLIPSHITGNKTLLVLTHCRSLVFFYINIGGTCVERHYHVRY